MLLTSREPDSTGGALEVSFKEKKRRVLDLRKRSKGEVRTKTPLESRSSFDFGLKVLFLALGFIKGCLGGTVYKH